MIDFITFISNVNSSRDIFARLYVLPRSSPSGKFAFEHTHKYNKGLERCSTWRIVVGERFGLQTQNETIVPYTKKC